jgi:hypothetical protein
MPSCFFLASASSVASTCALAVCMSASLASFSFLAFTFFTCTSIKKWAKENKILCLRVCVREITWQPLPRFQREKERERESTTWPMMDALMYSHPSWTDAPKAALRFLSLERNPSSLPFPSSIHNFLYFAPFEALLCFWVQAQLQKVKSLSSS